MSLLHGPFIPIMKAVRETAIEDMLKKHLIETESREHINDRCINWPASPHCRSVALHSDIIPWNKGESNAVKLAPTPNSHQPHGGGQDLYRIETV